jgi:hypothetical protein
MIPICGGRIIRDLKAQEGKNIYLMGGGELVKSLFEADLMVNWTIRFEGLAVQQTAYGRENGS